MAQFIRRNKTKQLLVQVKETTCDVVRLRVRMVRATLSIADEDGDIVSTGQPCFTLIYASIGEANGRRSSRFTLFGITLWIWRRVDGQTVIVRAWFLCFE